MLQVVDLNLLQAVSRYDADGRPKDPHEAHRRDHVARLRCLRRQSLLALWDKLRRSLPPLRRPMGSAAPSKC